jgi:V8-like Glu-specific endopeptidase
MMSTEPIPFTKIASRVGAREALSDAPADAVRATLFLHGREPVPQVQNVEVVNPTYTDDANVPLFRVDLDLPRLSVGVHAFGPGLAGTKLSARRKLLVEDEHVDQLTGFLPDHLAMRSLPSKLDRRLSARVKIDATALADPDTRWATTVFSPDDRYTFSDTAFPWCTAGRVETSSGGWASGVMIGPRHLLTCAHAIQWFANPDPYVAGWIKFMPSYFDGSTPFGAAWGTHIYWQQQVAGPTIDSVEARNDYVVVVLDRRMGDLTGWMGSRTYDDGWDGGAYWSHIGYPGDVSGGTRPTFQGNFGLNGDDAQPATNQAMYHLADVWPGQSGGPFFGWWDSEPWPRVVADQSWQNASTNGASGGSRMVDLVIRARSDFP